MKSLAFAIAPSISSTYPDICVGAFTVRRLASAATMLDVGALLDDARATLAGTGVTVENISDEPRIQGWRQAMVRSSLKPSTFKSSAEQLARRLLKEGTIGTPLPAVTAYCAVSAKHLAPLGAYDVARLPGDQIELRHAQSGSDVFTPLTGRAEDMPLKDSVAVYAVGPEIICWGFNFRDSRATCLLPDSQGGAVFGEAVTLQQRGALQAALAELSAVLSTAGATVGSVRYATAESPEFTLELPD